MWPGQHPSLDKWFSKSQPAEALSIFYMKSKPCRICQLFPQQPQPFETFHCYLEFSDSFPMSAELRRKAQMKELCENARGLCLILFLHDIHEPTLVFSHIHMTAFQGNTCSETRCL